MDLADLEARQVGQLQIRGGVGGVRFQLQELLDGAGRLEVLAAELGEVEIRMQEAQGSLFAYQLDTSATGSTAVMAARGALSEMTAVRSGLENISAGVRAAHRDYETSEAVRIFHRALGPLAPLQNGPLAGLLGSWPPSRETTEAWVGSAPVALGLLLLGLPRKEAVLVLAAHAAAGRSASDTRSAVRLVAESYGSGLAPRPVMASAGPGKTVMLEATPAGLLARVRQLQDGPGAAVEVIRVEGRNESSYVVIIPGTRGGEAGGSDPFDTAGIIEGLGYDSAETAAAIRTGLHAAGASQGDEVVAVGYSQGGIHAMNLARNGAFLKDFELKYVLTAGSPVGGVEPAPDISSLHLEHRQDWVPGSDGMPGPDARNRVTVTLTEPVETPDGQDAGLGPGHSLENYRAGAAELAASADPSVVESLKVLGGVVGAGGLATATKVSLTRVSGPTQSPSPARPARGRLPGRVRALVQRVPPGRG